MTLCNIDWSHIDVEPIKKHCSEGCHWSREFLSKRDVFRFEISSVVYLYLFTQITYTGLLTVHLVCGKCVHSLRLLNTVSHWNQALNPGAELSVKRGWQRVFTNKYRYIGPVHSQLHTLGVTKSDVYAYIGCLLLTPGYNRIGATYWSSVHVTGYTGQAWRRTPKYLQHTAIILLHSGQLSRDIGAVLETSRDTALRPYCAHLQFSHTSLTADRLKLPAINSSGKFERAS